MGRYVGDDNQTATSLVGEKAGAWRGFVRCTPIDLAERQATVTSPIGDAVGGKSGDCHHFDTLALIPQIEGSVSPDCDDRA